MSHEKKIHFAILFSLKVLRGKECDFQFWNNFTYILLTIQICICFRNWQILILVTSAQWYKLLVKYFRNISVEPFLVNNIWNEPVNVNIFNVYIRCEKKAVLMHMTIANSVKIPSDSKRAYNSIFVKFIRLFGLLVLIWSDVIFDPYQINFDDIKARRLCQKS